MTDEIIKLYENAGIDYEERYNNCTLNKEGQCELKCSCDICKYSEEKYIYPPFTTEKQLEIENVILQNKKNYNKWIEYNINVYGEWVIRFVRTDKFAPYIALGKTRAEAFANVINHFWQDLTEEEKQQVKGILE